MLGWEKIEVFIAKDLTEAVQLLEAERDENTCREDLSVLEGVAAGDAIEKLLKPKMKEHQGRPVGDGPLAALPSLPLLAANRQSSSSSSLYSQDANLASGSAIIAWSNWGTVGFTK